MELLVGTHGPVGWLLRSVSQGGTLLASDPSMSFIDRRPYSIDLKVILDLPAKHCQRNLEQL